ncbi:hypothetical protein LUZ60_002011 [Juncus effusus]|nr:hypothetical protein LUZ60_002011 [Juncus effusus]
MAKEEEVKKIDFKVNANCCDGCKRKIIKALNIKGVLKTEIHSSLPKITVTGNFDPRIILKKLAKIGKAAEIIMRDETEKPQKEEKKKSNDSNDTYEKEKKNKEEKSSESKSKTHDYSKESKETKSKEKGEEKSKNKGEKKEETENNDGNNNALLPTLVPAIPNYAMNPSIVSSSVPPLYYHTEPVMVPMHYSMNIPYSMNNNPYSMPIPYGYRENRYYEAPINRMAVPPPVHSQPSVFNDYFNEDNTSGCQVM